MSRAPSSAVFTSGHIGRDVAFGKDRRFPGAVGENGIGERPEAAFAGDLGAGAALRLVGQIEVFELRLGRGACDLAHQLVGHLALPGDRFDDRGAAGFQLAQIDQPLGESAQLRVVQPARHFLAVAGDEGNGRALVEQFDRSLGLIRPGIDFGGDDCGKRAEVCGHGDP